MDLRGTDLVVTPSEIVNFDKATPTTVGVVFDPNTPATTDVLYVSSVDASTWIYNGTSYVTYNKEVPSSTPFYLLGTTIDAGDNKTASIERTGLVKAGSFKGNGFNIDNINPTNVLYGKVPFVVDYATTAALPTNTATSTVITASANGALTIDGVAMTAGKEVLIKDEATQTKNGVYTVTNAGSVSTAFVLTRKSGADSIVGLNRAVVNVLFGTANAGKTYLQTTSSPNVGSSNIVFIAQTISAGGLTYFTEAQNSSSPNATVKVDSLTAVASTTDADFSIVPKGMGSFLLAIPDNTTTGGAKRGLYSVDLQMASRSVSDQVASGNYASLLGGYRSKVSGDHAIGGGNQAVASGLYSVSLGGAQNTASASYSACLGGTTNVASGLASFAGGGQGNTVSGSHSAVFGYANSISGAYTIRAGYGNTGNAEYSITSGYNNVVSGSENGCFGSSSTVSANYAFSLGYQNSVTGLYGIAIGKACTATNQSSLSIGLRCKATGENGLCIGGYFYSDSTASAQNSTVIGFGTASASFASVFGSGTADGQYSTAIGYQANTFGVAGRVSISGNVFTSAGDAQKSIVRAGRRTTDATTTVLTTNNGAIVNTGTQLTLQNQQLIRFKGTVTGKQSGSTNVGVWDIDGVIVRGANAASTTLTVSNVNLVTNASGWGTPVLSADTTNGCLKIEVTGLAGTNIQWLAILDTVENLYL